MVTCVPNKLQLYAKSPEFDWDFQEGKHTDKEFKKMAPPRTDTTSEPDH